MDISQNTVIIKDVVVHDSLEVSGASTFLSDMDISQNTVVSKDVVVHDSLDVSGSISIGSIYPQQDCVLSGGGSSDFIGTINLTGDLIHSGTTKHSGDYEHTGRMNLVDLVVTDYAQVKQLVVDDGGAPT